MSDDRYLDMALALTRASTSDTILAAGCVWDRLGRCRATRMPERFVTIRLEAAQVAFAEWFAEQLNDAREQRRRNVQLVLLESDRSNGLVVGAVACLLAALLDVPRTSWGGPSVAAIVSSTWLERDELLRVVRGFIPREWFVERRAPLWTLTFQTGGILRFLSDDDPESLKQGRLDWCLFTGSLPASQAAANALQGTANAGGLTIVVNRPHTTDSGEWLPRLSEAIDAGRAPGAIKFGALPGGR